MEMLVKKNSYRDVKVLLLGHLVDENELQDLVEQRLRRVQALLAEVQARVFGLLRDSRRVGVAENFAELVDLRLDDGLDVRRAVAEDLQEVVGRQSLTADQQGLQANDALGRIRRRRAVRYVLCLEVFAACQRRRWCPMLHLLTTFFRWNR